MSRSYWDGHSGNSATQQTSSAAVHKRRLSGGSAVPQHLCPQPECKHSEHGAYRRQSRGGGAHHGEGRALLRLRGEAGLEQVHEARVQHVRQHRPQAVVRHRHRDLRHGNGIVMSAS